MENLTMQGGFRCVKASLTQLAAHLAVQKVASVDGPLRNLEKDHKVCWSYDKMILSMHFAP